MTYLKRASRKIEDKILAETRKVNQQFDIPMDEDLKVYLRLKSDGSIMLNKTGQVGMTVLSDRDILNEITSGKVFSLQDNF
ncbi:hypothetical protein [Lactobacillus crispatus]|uniref:Uncharacterized protein n=1 Tax=Lactobacillus crispatus TaxID=47770 RepID=A0AAN5W998_9LACO|nr:hypothetical protein [Lactobacillus crispatus]KAA8780315.1 hypothetical protein F1C01_10665 [Lactobacillus crispatus]KAA8794433.1 hypothetical protein F1C00_05765 [Lactobacillus crispatus]KAA8796668.1 hypothetical protein F1C02_09240 [Lactobacillus crispatus]KAA8799923.1 hypothetical protein F1C03_09925 [Lactobacillus crispatus]KAA8802193.1 hypothetical protein F1C04_08895 [Lactobacillus crispatus]